MYPITESYLPNGDILGTNPSRPVHTVNEGTDEYQKLCMDALLKEIDIAGFVKPYLSSVDMNVRGNFQKHFGPASGKNVGVPDSDEETLDSFGTSKPRNNKGTKDPAVQRIVEYAAIIGRLLYVDICQDDFLSGEGRKFSEHIQFARDCYGSNKARFPSFSVAILPLREGSRVNRHRDLENCPNLPSTLIVSEILFHEGTWYRVSLIFYSRKSISDFIIRRGAMSEVTSKVDRWIGGIADYQKPWCDTQDFVRNGVGDLGFHVIVEKKTRLVVGLGLRSRPAIDKQGTFLSPIVCAIASLMKETDIQFSTEFFELISLVTYLNNLFVASVALNMMQSCWSRDQALPGGIVEYTLTLMKRITGCITGGPGRRCQNWMNRPIPRLCFRRNASLYRDYYRSHRSVERSGNRGQLNATDKRKNMQALVGKLSKEVIYGSEFSVSHVVWVMALFGILPSFYLDYAVVASKVNQNNISQKKTKKADKAPLLRRYLSSASTTSECRARLQTILKGVRQYLCARMGNQEVTESDAENVLCESSRAMKAEDIIMPGYSVFRKTPFIPEEARAYIAGDGWCSATPWLMNGDDWDPTNDPDVTLLGVVYSPLFDAEHMASGGYIQRTRGLDDSPDMKDLNALPRSPIWDPTVSNESEEMLSKFDVGRKSEKSTEFAELSFDTSEFVGRFPTLMTNLKIACAHHYGKPNNNKDFMNRINKIPELALLISSRLDGVDGRLTTKRKATQLPEPEEPKQHKSVRFADNLSISETKPAKTKGSRIVTLLVTQPSLNLGVDNLLPRSTGTAWNMCSHRILNGITYRLVVSETQSREVMLNSFGGYKTTDELLAGAHGVRQWSTPHNDAQLAINLSFPSGMPPIARFKTTQSKRRNSQSEPNISLVQSINGCRVESEHLMGASNGCRLFDRLALTLEGVLAPDGFWYFRTKDLAVQHAMLHVICSVGTPEFYERLRRRTLRAAQAPREETGGFFVVAYTVVGCCPTPQGTVGYFLIAENARPVAGLTSPRLYFGFPDRSYAESLVRDGSKNLVTGKKKRHDKTVLFVRVM